MRSAAASVASARSDDVAEIADRRGDDMEAGRQRRAAHAVPVDGEEPLAGTLRHVIAALSGRHPRNVRFTGRDHAILTERRFRPMICRLLPALGRAGENFLFRLRFMRSGLRTARGLPSWLPSCCSPPAPGADSGGGGGGADSAAAASRSPARCSGTGSVKVGLLLPLSATGNAGQIAQRPEERRRPGASAISRPPASRCWSRTTAARPTARAPRPAPPSRRAPS